MTEVSVPESIFTYGKRNPGQSETSLSASQVPSLSLSLGSSTPPPSSAKNVVVESPEDVVQEEEKKKKAGPRKRRLRKLAPSERPTARVHAAAKKNATPPPAPAQLINDLQEFDIDDEIDGDSVEDAYQPPEIEQQFDVEGEKHDEDTQKKKKKKKRKRLTKPAVSSEEHLRETTRQTQKLIVEAALLAGSSQMPRKKITDKISVVSFADKIKERLAQVRGTFVPVATDQTMVLTADMDAGAHEIPRDLEDEELIIVADSQRIKVSEPKPLPVMKKMRQGLDDIFGGNGDDANDDGTAIGWDPTKVYCLQIPSLVKINLWDPALIISVNVASGPSNQDQVEIDDELDEIDVSLNEEEMRDDLLLDVAPPTEPKDQEAPPTPVIVGEMDIGDELLLEDDDAEEEEDDDAIADELSAEPTNPKPLSSSVSNFLKAHQFLASNPGMDDDEDGGDEIDVEEVLWDGLEDEDEDEPGAVFNPTVPMEEEMEDAAVEASADVQNGSPTLPMDIDDDDDDDDQDQDPVPTLPMDLDEEVRDVQMPDEAGEPEFAPPLAKPSESAPKAKPTMDMFILRGDAAVEARERQEELDFQKRVEVEAKKLLDEEAAVDDFEFGEEDELEENSDSETAGMRKRPPAKEPEVVEDSGSGDSQPPAQNDHQWLFEDGLFSDEQSDEVPQVVPSAVREEDEEERKDGEPSLLDQLRMEKERAELRRIRDLYVRGQWRTEHLTKAMEEAGTGSSVNLNMEDYVDDDFAPNWNSIYNRDMIREKLKRSTSIANLLAQADEEDDDEDEDDEEGDSQDSEDEKAYRRKRRKLKKSLKRQITMELTSTMEQVSNGSLLNRSASMSSLGMLNRSASMSNLGSLGTGSSGDEVVELDAGVSQTAEMLKLIENKRQTSKVAAAAAAAAANKPSVFQSMRASNALKADVTPSDPLARFSTTLRRSTSKLVQQASVRNAELRRSSSSLNLTAGNSKPMFGDSRGPLEFQNKGTSKRKSNAPQRKTPVKKNKSPRKKRKKPAFFQQMNKY